MKRSGWLWSWFCTALLCFNSGCLGVRHSTRVVREKEQKRAMQFESQQAQNLFEAGVNQMKPHKEASNVQLSFSWLGWRSQADVVSDNALYNDEALVCDANGDGLITVPEAAGYRARVEEKVRLLESQAKEPRIAGKTDPPTTGQR